MRPSAAIRKSAGRRSTGPSTRPVLGPEAYLREAFERAMPPPEAKRLAEQLLARLQAAAVIAQARRDPAVAHRQVDEARAWLETVLPAAKRRR